jgi:hypothetical protein
MGTSFFPSSFVVGPFMFSIGLSLVRPLLILDAIVHRTTLFQSTSYTTPNWPSFGPPPVWDEFYVNRQEQNNWKEHEQAIVSTWLNKSTQWNHNRRDWYDTHLNRWAATPVSKLTLPFSNCSKSSWKEYLGRPILTQFVESGLCTFPEIISKILTMLSKRETRLLVAGLRCEWV